MPEYPDEFLTVSAEYETTERAFRDMSDPAGRRLLLYEMKRLLDRLQKIVERELDNDRGARSRRQD